MRWSSRWRITAKGFDADAARRGLGLVAMRERAELVGGTLELLRPRRRRDAGAADGADRTSEVHGMTRHDHRPARRRSCAGAARLPPPARGRPGDRGRRGGEQRRRSDPAGRGAEARRWWSWTWRCRHERPGGHHARSSRARPTRILMLSMIRRTRWCGRRWRPARAATS